MAQRDLVHRQHERVVARGERDRPRGDVAQVPGRGHRRSMAAMLEAISRQETYIVHLSTDCHAEPAFGLMRLLVTTNSRREHC